MIVIASVFEAVSALVGKVEVASSIDGYREEHFAGLTRSEELGPSSQLWQSK